MKLPEVGEKGQKLLSKATVLAVGAGGLGCASLPWLARSGVGRIIVLDPGTVDEPDLGRQLLYGHDNLGKPKSVVAAEVLSGMNPDVEVLPANVALDETNIRMFARNADLILDGTDQLAARRVINAYCVDTSTPWVYGGAVGWLGSVMAFHPDGPCWECVFSDAPARASCDAAGVIGPVVGWVGAMQAALIIQLVLGHARAGELVTANLLQMSFKSLAVKRNPNCLVCGGSNKM